MTGEEKQKAINALKISAPIMAMAQEEFNDYIQTLNKIMDWLEQEPCEDCISRQAVIDMTGLSEWFDSSDSYNEFVIALSDLPPVTPQPKVGHWIDKFGGVYRCSCCREIISIDTEIEFPNGITYKYCPNCGSYNGGEK